jgi:hypothetical protein
MNHKLLSTYLNDHLAGALAGSGLAARTAGANRAHAAYQPALDELAKEIREDLQTLRSLMSRLGVGADRAKMFGGWAAEKVGRLKPNGRLLTYSPLSRVEELEMLRIGVTGKRMLWRTLQLLSEQDKRLQEFDFAALLERAEAQLATIDACHALAVSDAFLAPA